MRNVACKGGCGKRREAPALNRVRSSLGHSVVAAWTCEDCRKRDERKKAGTPPPPEKKDLGFTLVPRKQRAAVGAGAKPQAAAVKTPRSQDPAAPRPPPPASPAAEPNQAAADEGEPPDESGSGTSIASA